MSSYEKSVKTSGIVGLMIVVHKPKTFKILELVVNHISNFKKIDSLVFEVSKLQFFPNTHTNIIGFVFRAHQKSEIY